MTFSFILFVLILGLLVLAGYLLRLSLWPVYILALFALVIATQSYRHRADVQALEQRNAQLEKLLNTMPDPALSPQDASVSENSTSFGTASDTATLREDDPALDALKQQYEELLVSYYYLRRCSQPGDTLYYEIMTALLEDLAALDAPAKMLENIALAAKGSHQEMYAATACNDEHAEILQTSMRAYLEQKGQIRLSK